MAVICVERLWVNWGLCVVMNSFALYSHLVNISMC